MLSFIIAASALVLFFVVVLYFCLRYSKQDAQGRSETKIDLMRKSPLGRWRY